MEPIAIIGLAFKLPQGAEDDSSLWDILEQGKSVMTSWPKSRANIDAFYESDVDRLNTMPAKGAHFLDGDFTAFDAPFFSISKNEAIAIDPQQRMLLETTFHALENAGIPIEDVAGTQTAVYAGSMESEYHRMVSKDPDEALLHTGTGVSISIMANRISWCFDLQGPSVQINTACSSSMVGIDLACQSLRCGQSSMALVTGSNLLLSPELSLYLANLNMLSPDGICWSYDHRANGYSRGEGIIVLVLKTLSSAISAGDNIRAVIPGAGSNQDGRTPGLTQPSASSQEALIRDVYRSCNLGFETTRYVEGHGTGTQVGDSIEIKAIGSIFRSSRSRKEPLFVGSVKSNVGHLEGGSGVAGILKSILILEKGIIPPNALFEKVNPKLNAERNNIQVLASCVKWPCAGLRRISVNSFGFGGSNAHVILDDAYHTLEALNLKRGLHSLETPEPTGHRLTNGSAPETQNTNGFTEGFHEIADKPTNLIDQKTARNDSLVSETEILATRDTNSTASPVADCENQLLVYSARDETTLKRILQQYGRYYNDSIKQSPKRLQDLAYTLAKRRSRMTLRAFTVGNASLSSEDIGLLNSDCVRSSLETHLCFVFTGQGAQYANMGLDLIRYPVFKSVLSKTNEVFQALGADWSLFDKLESAEGIDLPQHSQPICTALQLALIELLKSFNISPVAVVGHSSGEIAAAYAIGALTLESACKVSYHRGRLSGALMASNAAGAMMSVNLQEGNARPYLDKILPGADIHIACVNSPTNITLAGLEVDLDDLKRHLDDDGVFAQKLKTGMAYHTPVMQQIADEYLASLGILESAVPGGNATVMVSTVTGQKVTSAELATGQYWVDNSVSPVRFVDALQYLKQAAPKLDGVKEISDYVEIGPHGALRRPVLDTLSQMSSNKESRYMFVMSKHSSPLKTIMGAAGRLFTHGHPVSITAVNQDAVTASAPSALADTPQYPFDHSRQYWYESRLSRDWRLRGPAPRNVLGIRSADWNPLEPRWRKNLSIKETPWFADHVIDGLIVLPAAGIVVIAIEAVKQMAQEHQTISGFLIKEATFMRPISMQEDKKTEITTQLRPLNNAYERTSLRFEVKIFSVDDGGDWTECFKAVIHAQLSSETATEVDAGFEARAVEQAFSSSYDDATRSCTTPVTMQNFYKWLHNQGLCHGESFRLTEDISWDGRELSVARIKNPTELYEGVVHPTVLDNCLQICCVAPSGGMTKKGLATFIPSRLRETWISATGWQYPETRMIRVRSQSKLNQTMTGFESSFAALADDGTLLCHAKEAGMSAVAHKGQTEGDQKRLLHSIDWKPQLSLLSAQQLSEYCAADEYSDDETFASEFCVELEDTIRMSLENKLTQLQSLATAPETPAHLRHFVSWIQRQLFTRPGRPTNGILAEDTDETFARLRLARPSWRIFIDIAQAITSIVQGETDALDLLFSTPVAQDFYDDFFTRTCNHKLRSYLELAMHQIPDQRILEVGAGTGGMTNQVLAILRQIEERTGGTAVSEYVYTDVSSAYFDEARHRFGNETDRMSFKLLDLDQEESSTIEPGTYDMVLAGSVLHATKNLTSTLRNLRRALKPGGKLVILEITAPDCFLMGFGFGILPGWWCGEEESRKWCPTMTESDWEVLLKETGFSGNDMVIRDYKDDRAHQVSIIISTADTPSHTAVASSRIVVVVNEDEAQKSLGSDLVSQGINSPGYQLVLVTLCQLAEIELGPTDHVIFLADLGGTILADPSDDTFRLVQEWVQQSKQLLWVTACSVSGHSYPYTGLKDGFLRTIRSENDSKRIISLSLEDDPSNIHIFWKHITQVFSSAFETASPDAEYIVRDGRISTRRLVVEEEANKDLNASIHPHTRQQPWLPGPPVKLQIGTRGTLDTLRFIEDDDTRTTLGATEVEIENRAWPVGFRDVFVALGRLDENEFGTDCAGIVKRVGEGVTGLEAGDRVCTSFFGAMKTYVYREESDVLKIPDTLSMEAACGVINPALTAWYSLIDVARLTKDDKILIHSAAGGTGQLAIQIAKMVGAEIFATVGYGHKKQLLKDEYDIPASHIFYSRDLSFAKGVMRMTNGYGVDVVLNSIVGEGLRASWDCIAPCGRFVEIGKADIYANAPLPMAAFKNNVSFFAVDLRHLHYQKLDLMRRLFRTSLELVQGGTLHCPVPCHTYSVSNIQDAFRFIQSGQNTGRVVVTVEAENTVQKHLIQRKTWKFDSNAVYLVAAGLGGVGRSILRWMASRGARQLIVPSRSGATSDGAIQVVSEISALGVNILTPKCDLSSASSIQRILSDCAQTMGPIRGCINAAMVLQDSVFDNMTRAQWNTTIRSKVQTSWNLHTLLPKGLDFFVLLSSASGILGNVSQANYAAGCTFQDTLAQFRMKHNQNSTSIDLGLMRTVGIVAENEDLQKNFEKYAGLTAIEEEEFLGLLDIIFAPDYYSSSSTAKDQITMGIVPPAELTDRDGALPLEHLDRSLFAYFSKARAASSTTGPEHSLNAAVLFRQAKTVEEMVSVVVESVVQKLARGLMIKAEEVDADRPLHLYGVDSLVAVELRNWMNKEFAADVPVFELMSGKSIVTIGQLVAKTCQVKITS
ncbi:polyketide synthase PksD [Massariosphaeria phaeospora]|uniref:Polyketide synthase PksD n=1 Tax=Massariosphaeria phaeospora TaxID=100035 RepID=A0A7C8MAZ0_9PLEO|nr:polyketide synthase PksD [Massariosphaeria phaeospora]